MARYVGLDVGKTRTFACVVDASGRVLREDSLESSPPAIIAWLRQDRRRYNRIGLEAGGFAAWLAEGLAAEGLAVICIDARHAHGVLKARAIKTDRSDARGIADLMRTGTYRTVHRKSAYSQEILMLLTTRRALKRKLRDLDNLTRGILLQFGIRAPRLTTHARSRAVELAEEAPALRAAVAALAEVR